MRRIALAILLMAALPAAAGCRAASAQGILDKAEEAEEFVKKGQYMNAIEALDDAAVALWEKAPLIFRRALFVAEKPAGFGAFNPRENNVFNGSNVEMIAYAEPFGFGWEKSGDLWRTRMIADLTIRTKEGKILAEQSDFQRLEVSSRVRNREFMVHFTYTLSSIPKGEYVIDTTLRDEVGRKEGTFSLPFVVQ